MPGHRAGHGEGAFRLLLASVGIAGCLGAAAYAAAWPTSPGPGPNTADIDAAGATASAAAARRPGGRPGRPRITGHPAKTTFSTAAAFEFDAGQRGLRFQCRLDRGGWKACRAPIVFRGLAVGVHSFSVRALSRLGARSRAARFRWTLVEPKSFAIVPQLSDLGALYPGAPPIALPMVLSNPHPAPISVTSLHASVNADPVGCESGANLELIPSSASSSAPIRIPANGSVSLPAPGTSPPAIRLRDLSVNQDACKGARFPLEFSGSAHG